MGRLQTLTFSCRLENATCVPAMEGCTSRVVPKVRRRGALDTFQVFGEMGTIQTFVVSAKVPDINTPSPREFHAPGVWLNKTKPSARKATLTPVATAGPFSRGVTHQSIWVPAGRGLPTGSAKTFGSRLPRNKR